MHKSRMIIAMGIIGTALMLVGCGHAAGVIFPTPAKVRLWPAPPEKARIRYVGQLAGSADLKPAVGFGQNLGEALFGKAPTVSMRIPYALCTDGQDRLFVTDNDLQVVHVLNLNTRKYQQWRPGNDPKKKFGQPVGILWDPAGRLLVADSLAGFIYVFDSDGQETARIGQGTLQRPCGMAVDPIMQRLFVVDSAAHQVVVFSASGSLEARFGQRGNGPGQFNYPTNVALDNLGRIFVSDSLNFRVQVFDTSFKFVRQIGRKGDSPGYFAQPKNLALDAQDHLYVVDSNFETVQMFDSDGHLLMDFGEEGHSPGQFWLPAGIFIDRQNRIWLADSYNGRVQVFDFLAEEKP